MPPSRRGAARHAVSCKYMASQHTARAGFTLIEVLVAIAVITTISFAPFAIIAQHLIENALTADRVRANFMAQEVIEHVHHARDQAVLDPDAPSWFAGLHSADSSVNPYVPCIAYVEDTADGVSGQYCSVTCENNGTSADCTGGNGFVTGVASSAGVRGNDQGTCDGLSAKAGNDFTVTLDLIVPRQDEEMQYAQIRSCVSWEGRDGTVRKIEADETVFEWVVKG